VAGEWATQASPTCGTQAQREVIVGGRTPEIEPWSFQQEGAALQGSPARKAAIEFAESQGPRSCLNHHLRLLFLYLETGIPDGDGRARVCSESISQVGSSSSSITISNSKHDLLTCHDVALIGPLLLLLKMPNQIQPKLSSGRTLRHIT